jgi:transcriptional regulator with XRE-family HTH domain
MKTAKIKSRLNGLAILRNQLCVSQRTMAIYLNVNLSTIKLAELGERSLPMDALIKVAKMEITIRDKLQVINSECIHPAEQAQVAGFEADYKQLFEDRYKFQYNSYLLEQRLGAMTEQYKKTREKLQILETVLPEIDDNDLKTDSLERQYNVAKLLLLKCGFTAQALLKCRIALLKAQHELFDSMETHLKEGIPAFIFNDACS